MPGAKFWAISFFFMLVCIGLGSQMNHLIVFTVRLSFLKGSNRSFNLLNDKKCILISLKYKIPIPKRRYPYKEYRKIFYNLF